MTTENFSRPGAVDLSGISGAAPQSDAYTVVVDRENFQPLLESSVTAPVILAFVSPAQSPDSVQLADDLHTLANEFEGKFLLGRVDVDRNPEIAQAVQVQSLPYVVLVSQGRPMPLLQQAAPLAELRTALTSVFQQLTANGVTGRHQPRTAPAAEGEEDAVDPRYAPAQDALAAGDIDAAVAEYQKLLDANPADSEAAAGLAMAQVLQRTQGVDLNEARAAAAAAPDDVSAQIMVADLDLLGGHVDDAFNRLIDLVRRTTEADRDAAREHLIGLFAAVGDADERVLRARRDLASALF